MITYGAFAIGMAYLMSQLRGSVLQIALSLGGIFGGPTGGLFSMGILFPFANFKVRHVRIFCIFTENCV